MTDKGYGVILSDCKFKENAAQILMDSFALENEDILELFNGYCEIRGFEMNSSGRLKTQSKEGFVDWFEDEFTGNRLEGLLARVIDDAEFNGREYFQVRDCCLYVSAEVPVDDEDRKLMPTQKEIQQYLAKYMNPLLEEPVKVDWVDICE